jgi:hypothetical protein
MAVSEIPIAPYSAAELQRLIGDDATTTFEIYPNYIDCDPTNHGCNEPIEVQRDTDDTEDSEEEEDELEEDEEVDEDDEEDDDEEEEDDDEEDDDLDDEDEEEEDEEEVGVAALRATGSTHLRGAAVKGKTSEESALEEDDDVGDEGVDEDAAGGDSPETDRVVDAALRMSGLVAVASEYAANV